MFAPVRLIILLLSELSPVKVWLRSFYFLSFAFFYKDFSPFALSQLFDFDFFCTDGIERSLGLALVILEFAFVTKGFLLNKFRSGEVSFLWDLDFDFFSTLSPFSLRSLLLVRLLSFDLLLFMDLTLLSRLFDTLDEI
jgi:hypothetical protein